MPERFYLLSQIADTDLEEIFDYTTHKFGLEQAEKYLLEIEDVFLHLLKTPNWERKEMK